jgi:transposase
MPFIEQSIMSQRIEFCILASKSESNMSDLCMRFNITRRTGYKWLARYLEKGLAGLEEKSRRPHNFPNQTPAPIDQYVTGLRGKDPEWGLRNCIG